MGGFTQDDGYVQGVAPMHTILLLRILLELALSAAEPNSPLQLGPRYRYRYRANTVYHGVWSKCL
jgi:hypothetical protein